MNYDEFYKSFESLAGVVHKNLIGKGFSYATDEDRLHNFKAAAAILRCTPEQALLGFVTKHFVRLVDIVNRGEVPTEEVANELLGDGITYFYLLSGMWDELRCPQTVASEPVPENKKAPRKGA